MLTPARYQAKLVKRPLLTQVVTTAVLFGAGDVIAQQAVDKKGLEKHDLARTGRMVLYGGGESIFVLPFLPGHSLFQRESTSQPASPFRPLTTESIANRPPPKKAVFGPAATTWYKFLAKNVNLKSPNGTILARVALDQGVFAPVFIGVFLSSMATMEGNPVGEKLDKNYKTALTSNYMLWPFVQAVNFKVVPLEHRVLFVNVISIGWNCYLSYLNSS